MPGRCAAPPAPAMITWTPRDSASLANCFSQSGVRWAETIRHSCGTPKRLSISSAGDIVSQSDLLPMMTETRGLGSFCGMRQFYKAFHRRDAEDAEKK